MKTIDNTEIHLSPDLLKALQDGETLVLTQDAWPVAFIVPAGPPALKRPCGLAKGEFIVPDDFNDPLPDLEDEIYECPALAGLPPAS